MPRTDAITQARLKELLHYDPETGVLVWKVYRNRLARAGDIAGNQNPDGYIYIGIDRVKYKAHRLIFLCMLGWMPPEVDHDNHIRHDNRWVNLNPATHTENSKNCTLQSNNTSGHVGVVYNKRYGKWQAQIMVDYKNIFLGYFDELSDAIAAREAADIEYDFHKNHGSIKL